MRERFTIKFAIILILTLSMAKFALTDDKAYFHSGLIFEPRSAGFDSCHSATLVELPGGDILAAWYGGTAEKAKDVAIYAARLKKGETKWSKPWIIHDTPDKSEGNPVLWLAPDKTLWLFFTTIMMEHWDDARMFYRKSYDEGKTWTEQVTLIEDLGWMPRFKPLLLTNGDILLPIYDEMLYRSHFYISTDGGKKWKKSVQIITPGGAIQPSVVQLSDGSLLTVMRSGSKNGLAWWATSKDNGRHWSKPFTNILKNPGSGSDMVKLANGHLAIVFNDSPERRNPISAAISTDEGKTWNYKRVIEKDDFGEYSYPSVIATSDGLIHAVYTWRRESIGYAVFNEKWVLEGE
ncbi:MAG: sialidase family protein [bacterium]